MGSIVANGAIAGAREVRIVANEDRADGDFAGVGGGASLLQSKAHEMEIVGHGSVRITRQESVLARSRGESGIDCERGCWESP